MKHLKIEKPCTENWNEMNPTQKGAFCLKCTTEVHDFSNQSSEEIRATLLAFKGKEICGRITNKQLDNLNNDFHAWRDTNRWSVQRASFYAFLFVFGLTMVSCSNEKEEQQIIQVQERAMTLVVKDKVEKTTPEKMEAIQQTIEAPVEMMLGEFDISDDYQHEYLTKCMDSVTLPERNENVFVTMGMVVSSPTYFEHVVELAPKEERDELGRLIPTAFNALAFPNPTEGRTTLKFEVPESTHASFELYSMNGQRLKSMGAADYEPGTYEVPFDLSQLQPGTYLIGILSKNYKETVRVIKI